MTRFLDLPHPFPQVAEALNYNDDELAEYALRTCLTYGLSSMIAMAEDGSSNLDNAELPYAKRLLELESFEIEDFAEEGRKRLKAYRRAHVSDNIPF